VLDGWMDGWDGWDGWMDGWIRIELKDYLVNFKFCFYLVLYKIH